ncbi:MAG: phosphoribosylglycinamide synthetase C domain-containing protein, partial [Pseudomonadota bacterium]
PAPVMTDAMIEQTMEQIINPTLRGMAERGTPFTGVLYAGLMITPAGPRLIEYNVRFGDPECQVLMMRLKDDILMLMKAAADELLWTMSARWHDEAALCVVMATKGYPGPYEKGSRIGNLEAAAALHNVEVFHAGTALEGDQVIASGGRVLSVTALGSTVKEAHDQAYMAVDLIDWNDGFCRRDIGWRAIARQK